MSFKELFKFKYFNLYQDNCAMKIGTDAFVLGSLADANSGKNILDIGSGTGVLGFMLNQYFNSSHVTFVEIDRKAITTLKENVRLNPISATVIQGDFLAQEFNIKFDLIISNPPYFSDSSEAKSSERQLARDNASLEPKLFFKKVKEILAEDGLFWIILPFDNSQVYLDAAADSDLFIQQEVKVYGKPSVHRRNVFVFGFQQIQIKYSELCIRGLDGQYTEQYKVLTKDFHGVKL